jgi:hypothetical protein
MAKFAQKADVDNELADIILPQRSVPELMAELERSKQDQLERLATVLGLRVSPNLEPIRHRVELS